MSRFRVIGLDHVHVYVRDRAGAARWYASVLGFRRNARYACWAREIGGPLTLTAGDDVTHIALFEDAQRAGKATPFALRVDGESFVAFERRSAKLPLFDRRRRPSPPQLQDHQLSLSLYFNDVDGNPIELTTYDVALARPRIKQA